MFEGYSAELHSESFGLEGDLVSAIGEIHWSVNAAALHAFCPIVSLQKSGSQTRGPDGPSGLKEFPTGESRKTTKKGALMAP